LIPCICPLVAAPQLDDHIFDANRLSRPLASISVVVLCRRSLAWFCCGYRRLFIPEMATGPPNEQVIRSPFRATTTTAS
jgi:hypothetical protein